MGPTKVIDYLAWVGGRGDQVVSAVVCRDTDACLGRQKVLFHDPLHGKQEERACCPLCREGNVQ